MTTEVVETVKPWMSKTNLVGLAMAIVSFFPSVNDWVSTNPAMFMQITSGIIMILRFVTKGKISIV